MKKDDLIKFVKNNTSSTGGFSCEEGDNQIKLLSEFEAYYKHYDEKEEKTIICFGKEDGCPGCAKKIKGTPVFLAVVLDRADGLIKIGRFGGTAVSQMLDFKDKADFEYDVVPSYDFIITKTGKKLQTKYSVVASRKDTPLTDEENETIKAFMEKTSLLEVIEKMKNKSREENGVSDGSETAQDAPTSDELPIHDPEPIESQETPF